MLRSLALASLVLLSATSAATPAEADAIRPFDGTCPPGLESAIRSHREVCAPRACAADRDCPGGSSCREIFECWAGRPYAGGRFPAGEGAPTVDTVIGLCDEARHCDEGACRERRQCEPTEATPAWDPSERRWTEANHVAPSSCSARPGASGTSFSFAIACAALSIFVASRRLARRRA